MRSKVVVVGLRHGERHVHGFIAAGAQKVYAVDINKELYKNVLHDRVIVSDDYRAIMPLADMIVISLPPALHQEALQAAIKTKASHIWVEKPLLDVGEEPHNMPIDRRIEVIHELRRSQLVGDWAEGKNTCREAWLSWRRPVPAQFKPDAHHARYIGVVHDLGSHLVDLAFVLSKQTQAPKLESVESLSSQPTGAQTATFTLQFGEIPVHISVAWVDEADWPEQEITARLDTPSGMLSWVGYKATHRHFTDTGEPPTVEQIRAEQDWYTPALQHDDTFFAPLKTAIMVQTLCNKVVATLQETKQ